MASTHVCISRLGAHWRLSSSARSKMCPTLPPSRQTPPHYWLTYSLPRWANTDVLCLSSPPPTRQTLTHTSWPASTPQTWPALHIKIHNPYLQHKHSGDRKASKQRDILWATADKQLSVCLHSFLYLGWTCQPRRHCDPFSHTITPYCQTYRESIWACGTLCAAASPSWCKGGLLRSAGCWPKLGGCGPAQSRWGSRRRGFPWGRCATPALRPRRSAGRCWCTGCELWLRNSP